jgi:uncharacterized integral membrane protein (TIGR00697 family)
MTTSVIKNIDRKIKSRTYYYKENMPNFKYIRIMAMIYLTFLLSATVVAYKVVLVGPFPEPGSTLIYTFSFFLSNVYTESYGKHLAKRLILESIFCGYLFALLLSGVNLLPSPAYWGDNASAYNQVLGHVFRFTNAGVIGYLISSFLNVHLAEKWKLKMNGRQFWWRSLLSSSISEGVATFIAGIITFFGMMPSKNIMILMGSALAFKLAYGVVAVFPASFLSFLLKKKEISLMNNN